VTTPSAQSGIGGNASHDHLPLRDSLDYAWKWFQYHAGQRMLAFNFFLILMGALSVGYYKAYDSGSHLHAAVVAVFGVVVALAFFILEWRNEELVNIGRNALKSLEGLPEFSSLPDSCRLSTQDRRRSIFRSHKVWLRIIQFLLLAIFLLAFSQSLCNLIYEQESTQTTEQPTGDTIQMPYIKQERRDAILAGAKPQDAGELNFAITIVVDNYLRDKGGIRYAHLNEVVGAMECAKLELYRRLAAPYEDKKITEAGDVYRSNKGSAPSASQSGSP
jgi:hypothetical protein